MSVGNLRSGGSGKTPVVAYLARLLLTRGERPSILTRGYKRPVQKPGVTVVSDLSRVVASFETAGDEPLMLARALAGVPVLVGSDRYEAGRAAEERFGTTVHLLDDGFQHLALARDVDLLLVSDDDLADRLLPAGRLREPLSSASAAHALLIPSEREETAERVRRALGVADAFRLRRTIGRPPNRGKVFAIAGIARPEWFFHDLAAAGWNVAGAIGFADHHAFTAADIDRIAAAARSAGAATVVTTEKDAARLEGRAIHDLSIVAIPLTLSIEPAEAFAGWLFSRLSHVRTGALPATPGTLHSER